MAIGRSLLLTGSGGFLGSHLRQALSEVALFPQSSELDLLDLHAVRSYLTDHDVKTIIHAAGYVGGIGLNQAHPGRMIAENLRMGANVLQAAAERPGDPRVHCLHGMRLS
jgi:GDP-L-fucose synthase